MKCTYFKRESFTFYGMNSNHSEVLIDRETIKTMYWGTQQTLSTVNQRKMNECTSNAT